MQHGPTSYTQPRLSDKNAERGKKKMYSPDSKHLFFIRRCDSDRILLHRRSAPTVKVFSVDGGVLTLHNILIPAAHCVLLVKAERGQGHSHDSPTYCMGSDLSPFLCFLFPFAELISTHTHTLSPIHTHTHTLACKPHWEKSG